MTLFSFVCTFYEEYRKQPSLQQVFDAGVAEGIRRNQDCDAKMHVAKDKNARS